MKYNILFISHERKMGGANFALIELIKNLRNAGNNVFVVVLYSGCPIDIELKKIGIPTFPCLFGWWQQPEYWSKSLKFVFRFLHWMQWISVLRISKYVKKNQIQIIHSNSSVIDIGAQVAYKTNCRHVWHFREFIGTGYRLEYMYPKEKINDYISKHSDMVIFISKALQESYADLAKECHNTMIYDGIAVLSEKERNLARLQRNLLAENKRCPYRFLVTGNISPGKNQKLVLEAVDCLIHKMNMDKQSFEVHFAGTTTALQESKDYDILLRNLVKNHELSNVVFHGFVQDMTQLREEIDAEIISSVGEAYGRVTLEAMMTGNLVIASDSGSNPELLQNNRNGLLFRNNDAEDLAQKMVYAMQHSCNEQRKQALEYVYAIHTQDDACRKVQEVYSQICKNQHC